MKPVEIQHPTKSNPVKPGKKPVKRYESILAARMEFQRRSGHGWTWAHTSCTCCVCVCVCVFECVFRAGACERDGRTLDAAASVIRAAETLCSETVSGAPVERSVTDRIAALHRPGVCVCVSASSQSAARLRWPNESDLRAESRPRNELTNQQFRH